MRTHSPKIKNVTPSVTNTCVIIVTYFPDQDFISRLNNFTKQFNTLLIVDNTDSAHPFQETLTKIEKEQNQSVTVINNKTNTGIATALNQGCEWAIKSKFEWALTFDQDTEISNNMFNDLIQVYTDYPRKDRLAVLGANYVNSRAKIKDFATQTLRGEEKSSWSEVKTVITSGSLVSLPIYQFVGPFRDEFFIDSVDFEYCLRAKQKGLDIILTTRPLMYHPIGELTKQIRSVNFKYFDHSAFRRYFIARNAVLLSVEYLFKDPLWSLDKLWRLFRSIGALCLFGKNKTKKIKYTLLGIWDGMYHNTTRKIKNSNQGHLT